MKVEERIAHMAYWVGLTPFVPVPFLDEYLRIKMLKRMFKSIATEENIDLDDVTLKVLAEDRQPFIVGCFLVVFWWPLRKLLRVVFYFLTIKEFIDWTCEAVLRGEMVRIACVTGVLPGDPNRVRREMKRVLIAHPHSPLRRLLTLGKRPPMALADTDRITRFVYRTVQWGGGAIVLDAFERDLSNEE